MNGTERAAALEISSHQGFRPGVPEVQDPQDDDRHVSTFLEKALAAATLLFSVLMLLRGEAAPLTLSAVIASHIGLNLCISLLISRQSRSQTRLLEIVRNVFNAAFVLLVTLWVGPSSWIWLLLFLPIARTLLVFRQRWLRLGMVSFLAVSGGLAEALAGAGLAVGVEPVVILLGPALLAEALLQSFDDKLLQERREQQQPEKALRFASRMEAVGCLAAGIAHEISTPIRSASDSLLFVREGIQDLLQLQERYRQLAEVAGSQDRSTVERYRQRAAELEAAIEVPYLLERIPLALDRMFEGLASVSEILGSVRHVSRPGPSRLQPEDLNESIRATVRITTCAWKEVAEIRLRLGTLPRVECDLGELHQVLLNLLVNSARAIGEKSSCYPSRSGFIDVETSQVGEEVEILVSDNGCGIPEGQLPRVFDPFVSGGTFKESSGQGLRMAQAAICDHHGGSLSVESTVGEGTTVRIRLPVRSRRGVGGGSLGGPSASLQSTMGSTSSSV